MHGADVVVVGQFSAGQDRGPVKGLETVSKRELINPDNETIWHSWALCSEHQVNANLMCGYGMMPRIHPTAHTFQKRDTESSYTHQPPRIRWATPLTSKTWRRFFEPVL